ncbi:type I polyketide synthase [Nocardia terpenica]
MACRLPGGIESPEQFWGALLAGSVLVSELPPGRWNEYRNGDEDVFRALDGVIREGSFLDDVAGFDNEFFGISPREAELMDPQQRIVLETTWEALEHAGLRPSALAGTDAGVYMGVACDDYGRWMLQDPAGVEAWMGIGSALCGVANRVSYCLDLRGPSMSIDTACASSLVAIHLATKALRDGEIPVGIVGGVNIMAGPAFTLVLDAAGALAADGRSKPFDAHADGYGRGEGAGVLILKTLAAAERDGDRVLAVIRGGAVHQDGRTNGIMAPSSAAQIHLLQRAYGTIGIDPRTVAFVEAHGTGTPTGDVAEVQAMAAVLGVGRELDAPCMIGSAKANVGHLEGGAGIVGIIKTVLALRHGVIPAQPEMVPSSSVSWAESGLKVAQESMTWPIERGPRRAGVSAYGYGGTLAHIILEQGPDGPEAGDEEPEPDSVVLVPLSAPDTAGLSRVARRLAEHLGGTNKPRLIDVSSTLIHHREHHRARAAVVAATFGELVDGLESLANGSAADNCVLDAGSPGAAEVVWIFSGHGSQWAGMGSELLRDSPEFSAVIDEIAPIYQQELGVDPRIALAQGTFAETCIAQPMIYAMQVGLAAVWRADGIHPSAVIGHSVGEIAAAAVAGIFDNATGARLVCRRSALLRRVAGDGAMLFAACPFDVLANIFDPEFGAAPAVYTSPGSAVLSGDRDAVDRARKVLEDRGIGTRAVASDVAFHSAHMDPLLDDLRAAVEDLTIGVAALPVYTTALEDARSGVRRDGAYWAQNLRNPVRFEQAVSTAVADGYRHFLELSPHPVVTHAVDEILGHLNIDEPTICHSTRRDLPERREIQLNRARLYVRGASIDTETASRGVFVDIPTYPWSRAPHWFRGRQSEAAFRSHHDPASHTLLGGHSSIHLAQDISAWTTQLDFASRPYPGSHTVEGIEVIPAAAIVNTFLVVGAAPGLSNRLRDVGFRRPITTTRRLDVQVVLSDERLSIVTRPAGSADRKTDSRWVDNAYARIEPVGHVLSNGPKWQMPERSAAADLDSDYIAQRLRRIGVASTGFEWMIGRLYRTSSEFVAEVAASSGPSGSWAPILDAIFSIGAVAVGDSMRLKMAAGVQDVTLTGSAPDRVLLQLSARRGIVDVVDVVIVSMDSNVIGHLGGVEYRSPETVEEDAVGESGFVQQIAWKSCTLPSRPPGGRRTPERAIVVGGTDWLPADSPGMAVEVVGTPDELPDDIDDRVAIVVHPECEPTQLPAAGAHNAAWALIATIQIVARRSLARSPRIWALTRGVRDASSVDSLAQSPLWGVGRVLATEHPQLWGGTVDLPEQPGDGDIRQLFDVIRSQPVEDVISIGNDRCSAARLQNIVPETAVHKLTCHSEGTYVVTGGLGALGRKVTEWLISRGAGTVVLVNRTGRTRGEPSAPDNLSAFGSMIRVVACDIADPAAFSEALREVLEDLPPVRGVVHAAGMFENRVAIDIDPESLAETMRPKVDGAQALHRMFEPGELDFFVLFSAAGPLLGFAGQSGYAAANSYLDALANHRRAHGGNETISISWTSWRGLGISSVPAVVDAELMTRGAADITADEAFRAWDTAMGVEQAHVAVIRFTDIDIAVKPPILSEVRHRPAGGDQYSSAPPVGPGDISAVVRRAIAKETGRRPEDIHADRPLNDLGLDSIMTMNIRRGLEREYRVRLPASLMWEQPTVESITNTVHERLQLHPGGPGKP